MVRTRSVTEKKEKEAGSRDTSETQDSGETATASTSATGNTSTSKTTTDTDATTATEETTTTQKTASAKVDTSGIAGTPAPSTATVTAQDPPTTPPAGELMPPPPPAARARSRHSKASSKRLLAELEAKERLATLELERVRAEANLEKIRQDKIAAEAQTDSEDEGEDMLAPIRVDEWFERRNVATSRPEGKEDGGRKPAGRSLYAAGPELLDARPTPPTSAAIEVATLSAALAEAIQAARSNKKFVPDLPTFTGLAREWLHYKATYVETAPTFSSSENVARIRKSLKGNALDAVSALLISCPRPEELVAALERRFGRPDALLMEELDKMKNIPRLTENARDLCVFASRIANTAATINILKKPHYLYNPEVLRSIVDKLTPILKNKWYDYAALHEDTPDLMKMAAFLNIEADKCAPYASPEPTEKTEKPARKARIERAYVQAVAPTTPSKEKQAACPLCEDEDHALPHCSKFKKMNTNDRWETAKHNHICYRCLSSKHKRFACRAKPCGREGCPMRHHHMLHHDKPANDAETKHEEKIVASATEITAAATGAGRAYLKIAPVTLRGPHASVDTYALLDDSSSITILDGAIADVLGLEGPNQPMWVQGVSGTEVAHRDSRKINVSIQNRHGGERHILSARTVAHLDFTTQSVSQQEVDGCAHLEDIKHEILYENATPKILIGQDNWELIVAQEMKKGHRNQLVASKTALGWVLHGCRTSNAAPVAYCCAHLSQRKPLDDIEENMKKYFALESLNIEPRRQNSDPELQALRILQDRSRRLPDGRFETALLWQISENEEIPNNRADAMKRLVTLEKKLDRNEKLKQQYKERIANLLQSNYAELAPPTTSKRTWYLPHFAVCNPEKPKIRLVHDAAAKSHGRSLNSMLLSGPDLLQSLPGVIMRFRQHQYAVSADIKEMFMQIKIREDDRDAQRFLWRGDLRTGEPTEYRMSSVIFGATSSPCTALYIKNRNAREHADEYPDAARAIERNHYMDDYLQSFATLTEAQQITKKVDLVHKKAGFHLRGWTANNKAALQEVHKSERDDTMDTTGGSEREGTTVSIGGNETEKALGLLWNTNEDTICFRLNTRRISTEVLEDRRPPTKREALSIIMSVFDPLGLISTIMTPAKRIMQDTWRYNTGWDDPIHEDLQERWRAWLRQLRDLETLKIPRCYNAEPATRYELHTFVDASEEAYATAVYWRIIHSDGAIQVVLAAAKSRVTPNKPISIPRLELQAAVLGARLARTIAEEHDYEISRKIYWSDSRTALAWIRAEPRTFKTFVAHRLAEIEDLTKKDEWRWLPSADNVADDATRATPPDFDAQHRWYRGPTFLYGNESGWPKENKVENPVTGEEKEKCAALNQREDGHAHLPKIERFSSWTRLIRTTARVLQFIDLSGGRGGSDAQLIAAAKCKRTRANKEKDGAWARNKPKLNRTRKSTTAQKSEGKGLKLLEAQYLIKAEKLWIRAAQEDSYEKERDRIIRGRAPEKDDKLSHLSVYLDESHILRLKGRITAADALNEDMACPIVLYGKHPYAKLYMQHVHEKLHHGGTEILVNELRQRFQIERIRPAAKGVIARCPRCLLKKARPAKPATGDLPAARLAHHTRPFTHTGLDYFGPLEVTVAHHHEKRYVALFTCMTSRAIHLEVVSSLSTDSAINALRRFIARRGAPREIWSDNGTAFKGANRELTEAIRENAAAQQIEWRFLPPAAPFMAGVWERMVRTVKEALKATLYEKYPSDETLQTLLAEAEMTVNSRPLTYVAVGPEDPPAITPNMILIGPHGTASAPGIFNEDDENARQHWRRAQQLADTFWRRWVQEYLPILQHRREPNSTGTPPAIGDVVIICDNNLPRNTWPRGRVTQIYPGKDGEVRVVDVTTSRGHVLRRPTKKIVVLPVNSQGDGGRNVHDGNM